MIWTAVGSIGTVLGVIAALLVSGQDTTEAVPPPTASPVLSTSPDATETLKTKLIDRVQNRNIQNCRDAAWRDRLNGPIFTLQCDVKGSDGVPDYILVAPFENRAALNTFMLSWPVSDLTPEQRCQAGHPFIGSWRVDAGSIQVLDSCHSTVDPNDFGFGGFICDTDAAGRTTNIVWSFVRDAWVEHEGKYFVVVARSDIADSARLFTWWQSIPV